MPYRDFANAVAAVGATLEISGKVIHILPYATPQQGHIASDREFIAPRYYLFGSPLLRSFVG
ncbi:MAG: hypothetical protein JWQ98_2661 [Chlorobi bacterium]|nr:hypothetical protein [Chlorobiota bacterium]